MRRLRKEFQRETHPRRVSLWASLLAFLRSESKCLRGMSAKLVNRNNLSAIVIMCRVNTRNLFTLFAIFLTDFDTFPYEFVVLILFAVDNICNILYNICKMLHIEEVSA